MKEIKNNELLSAMRKVFKELRAETNLSQGAVVADIFDAKNVTINMARIETGVGDISSSTIFLLCEYYKIPISDFFKRVEDVDKKIKINFQNKV